MTLISRPFRASDGLLVDTSTKLTEPVARGMWAAGVRGIWRYFFFGPPRPQDLDAAELRMLLDIGFWVGGVQHVPFPGWRADGPTGRAHAQAAVANAIRAGFVTPPGCHPVSLALDAEGVGAGSAMPDYAREGFRVRVAHAYQAVGYNGYECGLTGTDLDALNADPTCGGDQLAWWADFASLASRPAPKKGYAGHQKPQTTIAGVLVDVDQVLQDGVIFGLADDGVRSVADIAPAALEETALMPPPGSDGSDLPPDAA